MLDVSCVIPAAGFSSRMGSWKGRLPVKSEEGEEVPLLLNTVRTALSVCSEAVLVAGRQAHEILELTVGLDRLSVVENPDAEKGMLSSIQRALTIVEGDFFIVPMDMPLIRADHYNRLYKDFLDRGDRRILRPRFEGVFGHPVLFPARYIEKILNMEGRALKPLLNPRELDFLDWEDRSVIFDMDTEEAYREYLQISG
ncbi:MAG: NTP transferase domain-containing protein [Spirochaetales bacterium]|nr:NTP transferase domain-containing protein [Spirochaetales bacterium]